MPSMLVISCLSKKIQAYMRSNRFRISKKGSRRPYASLVRMESKLFRGISFRLSKLGFVLLRWSHLLWNGAQSSCMKKDHRQQRSEAGASSSKTLCQRSVLSDHVNSRNKDALTTTLAQISRLVLDRFSSFLPKGQL